MIVDIVLSGLILIGVSAWLIPLLPDWLTHTLAALELTTWLLLLTDIAGRAWDTWDDR